MKSLLHLKNILLLYLFSASSALAVAFPDAVGQPQGGYKSVLPTTPKNLAEMACIIIKLAQSFIPFLIVIAVGAFLQGLVKYIGHGDDEEKRSEGIKLMIYGTLGFFFMVSVWAILRLVAGSFGLGLFIPQFKASAPFVCN